MGKGLMQESGKREGCGCSEVAGIPSFFLPCFGVMRDRARNSGSGGWSLEDENPAAQQEVHRGHPWSSHMGANMCKWVTWNPGPASTGSKASSLMNYILTLNFICKHCKILTL